MDDESALCSSTAVDSYLCRGTLHHQVAQCVEGRKLERSVILTKIRQEGRCQIDHIEVGLQCFDTSG